MSWIGAAIGGALNLGGSVVSTIFGIKKEKAKVIDSALNILSDVNASDNARMAAVATIIASENAAGGLASRWRPLLMLTFAGLIVASWFGYTPPNIDIQNSMIDRLFDIVELGIGGYIGGRTLEKVMSGINISRIINRFVDKLT